MASSSIAGPSREIKPPPMKRNFITNAKPVTVIDSDDEIILVDDGSSDIEILGVGNAGPSFNSTGLQSLNKQARKAPPKPEVIDLSMDDVEMAPSLSTVINQRTDDDYCSDSDSIPEGFELWEPTVPLRITRNLPAPKPEQIDDPEPELAWHPPKMSWFREDCKGARSAGAFIEPVVRRYGRPTRIEMVETDLSFCRGTLGMPRWARERTRVGPPRDVITRYESSILYADPMIPIPGMNAPRGAVNCIAQAKGYIAVGRTYEEAAAYDGGGLNLWRVKAQKALDVPAHITHQPVPHTRRNAEALPPERIQNSILAVGFDPADNTKLLSAGHDNRIQLWNINDEEDTVELVQSQKLRHPGCMAFCPEGNIVAVGHAEGLRLYNIAESLKPGYGWGYKSKGHETVSAAWGTGRSQYKVVAGTQQEELVDGRLVFIDAVVGKGLAFLNAEACSTLSFDPTGNITAFTGSGRDGKPRKHVLRLYDVNRTAWRTTAQIGIPSSKTNTNGEVIEALWSPNGIHLACARDDNSVDIFDTRWLGQKQCMLVFKHDTDSSMSEGENPELYGVQGISWFGSEKLVSGGADHCVRVWDVKRDDECRVLATLGGAVGYLVGSEDPELFPIVAGDLLGNAYYLPNRLLVPRP